MTIQVILTVLFMAGVWLALPLVIELVVAVGCLVGIAIMAPLNFILLTVPMAILDKIEGHWPRHPRRV